MGGACRMWREELRWKRSVSGSNVEVRRVRSITVQFAVSDLGGVKEKKKENNTCI